MNVKPKRASLSKRSSNHFQFRIVYTDESVQYFSKRCSPEIAKNILEKIRNRIALGTFDLNDFTHIRAKSISFLNFVTEYLNHRETLVSSRQLSKATVDADYHALLLFEKYIGNKIYINSITDSTIYKFIQYLLNEAKTIYDKNYTPASVNHYLRHLQSAFSYAQKKGYIEENPFLQIDWLPEQRNKRIFTESEISQIRNECAKYKTRWKADIFNLALWTGGRLSELLNIKQVDFEYTNLPRLGRFPFLTLYGKGNRTRYVPIGPNAEELLKERIFILTNKKEIKNIIAVGSPVNEDIYEERIKKGYIFFEIKDRNTVTHAFKRILKSCGIADACFHDIRKTYATYSLESGVTMETVKSALGHSTIRMTEQVYTNITLQKLAIESKLIEEK